MNYIELYKQKPTKMRYKVSALVDDVDDYNFLLEMWGDIRLVMFDDVCFFRFNEAKEAIKLLRNIIETFRSSATSTEEYEKLLRRLETEDLIPSKKQRPVLFKGDFKRIVNGKLYDTSKAILIKEELENENSALDFIYKRYYKTKKGSKFVVIQGGPRSKYSKKVNTNERKGDIVLEVL